MELVRKREGRLMPNEVTKTIPMLEIDPNVIIQVVNYTLAQDVLVQYSLPPMTQDWEVGEDYAKVYGLSLLQSEIRHLGWPPTSRESSLTYKGISIPNNDLKVVFEYEGNFLPKSELVFLTQGYLHRDPFSDYLITKLQYYRACFLGLIEDPSFEGGLGEVEVSEFYMYSLRVSERMRNLNWKTF